MDENTSGGEAGDRGWTTEDELEIDNFTFPSSLSPVPLQRVESACSSAGSSCTKLLDNFVRMGFSHNSVAAAIKESGESNPDYILETLLTYSALEDLPPEEQERAFENSHSEDQVPIKEEPDDGSDNYSADLVGSFLDDFSDMSSWSENEEVSTPMSDEENKLLFLTSMGYPKGEAEIAMERCGPDATMDELTDFLCAAQMARADDVLYEEEEKPKPVSFFDKKRKQSLTLFQKKKQIKFEKRVVTEGDNRVHLPKPMIGFGVPTQECFTIHRTLPKGVAGPPYFYFENVALAPKGVWETMSRFLYDIEPEFVDSAYFCAAHRKRGYIHNLPIENRFPLRPLQHFTIQDALPLTRKWWPKWDKRTKFNCLQTCIGSAKLAERIRKAVENCGDDPPPSAQKFVMEQCKKWNLVWVGHNKVAPLDPDELEMLLGFPKYHTRGGGISQTNRYKALGNSFQVDTVAYHLSVLKAMYPSGMNVLSLFSGIGGGEVALHRLGIKLKNVVSVEISESRNAVRSWWEQTNQTGNLIHIQDVQELTADKLEEMMKTFGGFDLVIGGSPCNNLTGSNRHHRDGLEGKESSLFFEFYRILDQVRSMAQRT